MSSAEAALAPAPGVPERPKMGRPSGFNERTLDLLCSFIRETGVSDSGAAARAGLHPSTVSRWKRDSADFAILLRAAREEFRQVQLDVILREAQSGGAGWRASAWILERLFPEDYSPRADERAKFQERLDAVRAAEGEGAEVRPWEAEMEESIRQWDNESRRETHDRGEALQNVQKSAGVAAKTAHGVETQTGDALQNVQKSPAVAPARAAGVGEAAADLAEFTAGLTLDDARKGGASGVRLPERPLQNVQKSPLAGPMRPPGATAGGAGVAFAQA